MGKCYSRLSLQERLIIEKLYKKGMTMAETERIAKMIGRNRTTVYREILHNTLDGQVYNAREAQKRAKENIRKKSVAKQLAKGEDTCRKVYELWKEDPRMERQEMAEKIGCAKSTVFRHLNKITSGSYPSE